MKAESGLLPARGASYCLGPGLSFFFSLDTSFLGNRVPGIKPKHELLQPGATPSFKSRASCMMRSRFRCVGLRMVWFLSVCDRTNPEQTVLPLSYIPTPSAGLKASRECSLV